MADQALSSCASCCKSKTELPEGTKLLRCGRCKTVNYCSKECQSKAWKNHKKTCTPSFASNTEPTTTSERKQIILITLEDSSWLGDMYDNIRHAMRAKSDFIEVTKANAAIDKIATNPAAVILFEPSIMQKGKRNKHQNLHDTLITYTRAGGTVIFGCTCSSHVRPSDVEWYFSTVWDLPWKSGNYARYDFEPHPSNGTINGKNIPRKYNVKALQLENVDGDAVVYRQAGGAHGLLAQMASQGMLDFEPHGPNPGGNGGPVIWKKYDNGWLAWLGDVNNEAETREIMMMMCGL